MAQCKRCGVTPDGAGKCICSGEPVASGTSPVEGGGVQRTEIHCHHCGKAFVAELDFGISGDYVIECAHCGHEHWRSIKEGKITEARWGTGGNDQATRVSGRSVWKSSVIKAKTSTVAWHIRERWLNRDQIGG